MAQRIDNILYQVFSDRGSSNICPSKRRLPIIALPPEPDRTARYNRIKVYLRGVIVGWAALSGVSIRALAAEADSQSVPASLKQTLTGIWRSFVAHTPYFAAGLIILLLTWAATLIASRILSKALTRTRLRPSLQELVHRFILIGIWIAGILIAAMIVFPGLTPAKALGAMGIASIAVGFAFKDIFENFFAGILLLWRFPFENGDVIECEGITGRVEKVSVRMTQIRPPTGELVVMPNSTLFKNPVEVLTNRKKRRISIIAGVAYGEDLQHAVTVIEKAVQTCESVDTGQKIQVFPQAFGASSIDIEVAWWAGSTPLDVRRSRGEVVTAIKKALDEAGIEIPFPYRTHTFKEPLKLEKH